MMNPLTILAWLLALGQTHASTHSATCPVPDSAAVRLAKLFVTQHTQFQTEHAMSSIDTASVRPLVDATDSTVCAQLNDALDPSSEYSYLAAGSYYLVLVVHPTVTAPDGTTYTPEWKPLAVFDTALNFLGVEGI